MKNLKIPLVRGGLIAVFAGSLCLGVTGCASGKKAASDNTRVAVTEPNTARDEGSVTVPVVANVRAEPDFVKLDEQFGVTRTVQVFADVQSPGAQVDQVKLRLNYSPELGDDLRALRQPLDIEMSPIGGSTWRASLSPEVLKALAISGSEIRFEGQVVAQNDKGQTATHAEPIEVTIEAPPVVAG